MNAVIYARFSPRPGAETCESIELQMERCRAYCASRAYTLTSAHDDKELSGGRADNRPGLQAAIEAACKDKAVLVSYSLSRLARNVRDALAIVDQLARCGANLALLDLQVDTATPMGRCVFTILAAVAELERQQISQRTSDAMRRHQANGKRMSARLPYGYRLVKRGGSLMEVDPNEQAVMAQIASLAGQGIGLREICRRLKTQGIKCRGGKWHHSTISNIILKQKIQA